MTDSAQDVRLDADAVTEWLQRVYGDAPGSLIVSHEPARGRFVGTGGQCANPQQVLDRVQRLDHAGARGIYLRTTTIARRLDRNERGGARDSHALPGLWADVDFGQVGHAASAALPLPPDAEGAWKIVQASGLPEPSLWVHSGGGLYPWWLLDIPLILTDDTRPMATDLSAKWQQALGRSAERLGWDYGTGVGDLSRVLRIPGTVNRKAGQARPCRLVQDTGAAYALSELTEALAKVTPTRVSAPSPTAAPRRASSIVPHTGTSAFDQLDRHVSFDDLLTGAGWTLHTGHHPPAVDQCWTRPGTPEHACSAHTLTANPHVLVVHSEAAGLPTGGGQKLTRGRLFARLHHHGDETAAAVDIFAAIGGRPCTPAAAALPLPREQPVTPTRPVDRGDLIQLEHQAAAQPVAGCTAETRSPNEDARRTGEPFDVERDDFWTARSELAQIRRFARARFASPWATLGVTLARVISHVQPHYVLPAIIGGDASLNLFVGIVAPSGTGKGAAEGVSRAAVHFPLLDLVEEMPVGSGEGLAHAYVRYVPGKGTEKGGVEQYNKRALFSVHEVDTLTALKGRQGSTLLPQLRSAWMGERLGFQNADPTRRLNLRPHAYRLCLTVGIQPTRAGVLLDDADGGTPQRFLWLPGTDPNVPDDDQDPPDPITWRPPDARGHTADARTGHYALPVCDEAVTAIKTAARARMRGGVDALDGHALLCQLKTAAGLAFLGSRAEVSGQDWHLAGIVMEISDHTRAQIQARLAAAHRATAEARGRNEGLRAIAADEVKTEAATKRVARAITRKIAGEWRPRSDIYRALNSRDRDYFDDAIERLISTGIIERNNVEYNGTSGVHYRRLDGVA